MFVFGNLQLKFMLCCSIDATRNSRLGRYINDSPARFANCVPKAMFICEKPRILFFATQLISPGTELRFNYGGHVPWRKVGDF